MIWNHFVVSEGTSEGILQFNADRELQRLFGANTTGSLSLIELFKRYLYRGAKGQDALRTPAPVISLDIAEDNMVFSVTQQADSQFDSIKRLNLAGANTFQFSNFGRPDYVDVSVSPSGSYYAVTGNGYIDEYSNDGMFLYQFGGRRPAQTETGS